MREFGFRSFRNGLADANFLRSAATVAVELLGI